MAALRFIKGYVRDTSLAVEDAWVRSFRDVEKILGVQNPHAPYILLYVDERNLTIWENPEALQWFQDQLLHASQTNPGFMADAIRAYREAIATLETAIVDGLIKDATSYREALQRAMGYFNIWYYAGVDDRTPQTIRQLCLDVREHDYIFADQDRIVKQTLVAQGIPRPLANLVRLDQLDALPAESELLASKAGVIIVGDITAVSTFEAFANAHPEFEFIAEKADESITEVRGQPGYKGFVRGPARIVHNYGDVPKVQDGDVLCASMTIPDFLPAMHKAAAFVTDEGGIMCHAAIVAREMGKPCVIGTRIATQVFKDGDMVEVDAEKGIVRKV